MTDKTLFVPLRGTEITPTQSSSVGEPPYTFLRYTRETDIQFLFFNCYISSEQQQRALPKAIYF